MIIRFGSSTFRDEKDTVGVFDLDITSQSHITRGFLRASEERGEVVNAAEDIPKSFALCNGKNKGTEIILCQSNTKTVLRTV